MRGRAYRRFHSFLKQEQRKKLVKNLCWCEVQEKYIRHMRFASCWRKTNNKSFRKRKKHGNYAKSYNPPLKDIKRNIAMDMDEENSLY